MPEYPLSYPHELLLALKKTRKAAFVTWIRSHPERAAKLGLDNVIEGEVIKLCLVPLPNATATVVAFGTHSWISDEQKAFWIQVKDKVPAAWKDDIDGAIRRTDNRLDFDDWLAGLSTPLYRIVEDE